MARDCSIPRWCARLAAALAVVAAASCQATPLPMPPSARVDPARASLGSAQAGTVTLRGRSGALDPGDVTLRVTSAAGLSERRVRADGSFSVTLPGALDDVLYLEVVEPDRDVFVAALRQAAAGGGAVEEAPAGPDGDGDGSPDAVDCAPADRGQAGRRCAPTTCVPLPEVCNGLDDDCDGMVDEDAACFCPAPLALCGEACVDPATDIDHCGGCDAPCEDGVVCEARVCGGGVPCVTDADCAAGEICLTGLCTAM